MTQPANRHGKNPDQVPLQEPLSGISVVECGQGVAAAFGAKLLAILGAAVIKVEPPEGDITRRRGPFLNDIPDAENSGLFWYLNADKRGVTLDLNQAPDRQTLNDLLNGADILIHNVPPAQRPSCGLESDTLSRRHPRLIIAAISPYGDFGPRSHYKAYELNTSHASGMAALNPAVSDRPDFPPLKTFDHQADYQAGIHAAMTALGAFYLRTRSGAGQAIEVSAQECLATMLDLSLVWYTYQGKQTSRLGSAVIGPGGQYPCADGMVQIACVEEAQWQRLVELMGNPHWAHEERFKDRISRGQHNDALTALLEKWTANHKVRDLVREMQARRIPSAPVSKMADIYSDEQLKYRNFMVPLPARDPASAPILMPGMPFKSTAMGWSMRRPAPCLGEHNREILERVSSRRDTDADNAAAAGASAELNSDGPLRGIRVLDFTWVFAGPFCTSQLARMGAEVIRIESAKHPCVSRTFQPQADRKFGLNRGGSFNEKNHNKLSLQLNLARPEAVEIALRLAAHCDIAVENFACGVINRMGLGYDVLRARRPDLIMLSMAGYGQTGPFRERVSYGPMMSAHSGLQTLTTYPGDAARSLGTPYADSVIGIFGAYLLSAALIHRDRTGRGQFIDLSNLEALEMLMPEALLEYAMHRREPQPMGNRDRCMCPHNCYKTSGDAESWVAIAVGNEQEWRALCAAMDKPAMADDPRFASAALRKQNEDELDRIITAWTSERDRWEITELLQRAGVAAIPTLGNKDIILDQHLRERGFLVDLDHPEVGRRTYPGVPWTMSVTPCKLWRASPCLGADTDQVLTTMLGYTPEQLEELRRTEIIA